MSEQTTGLAFWGRVSTEDHQDPAAPRQGRTAGRDVRLDAWRWAQDNLSEDGSLPSGKKIAGQYGRHERWGRLVKRSGLAGDLTG